MGKVVVVVENGTVQQVLVDDQSVQVLVLDRELSGTDGAIRLPDVLGEPAAADALVQALPHYAPAKVEQAFGEVAECLYTGGVGGACIRTAREALKAQPGSLEYGVGTSRRIECLFFDEDFDIKAAPGPGEHPTTCDLYLDEPGPAQYCFATLDQTPTGWTATVYARDYEDGKSEGLKEIKCEPGASAFVAASFVLYFFMHHAEGQFEL